MRPAEIRENFRQSCSREADGAGRIEPCSARAHEKPRKFRMPCENGRLEGPQLILARVEDPGANVQRLIRVLPGGNQLQRSSGTAEGRRLGSGVTFRPR